MTWLPLLLVVQRPVICIDPGHPSEVGRGTHGKRLTEIHANWLVANELAALLKKDGYSVVLTKHSEGEKVTNKRRAEIANHAHAALFLRLHCDGSKGSGYAVYFPAEAGRLGSFVGPPESVRKASHAAADLICAALDSGLAGELASNGVKPDTKTTIGRQHGALVGSIYAKEPVVLVEMATLTNPGDESFMLSKDGRRKLARALEQGVLAATKK